MRRIAVLAAVAALTLAACGGDDQPASSGASGGSSSSSSNSKSSGAYGGGSDSSASGGGATLKIAADPGGALKFTKTALTAKAGEVTVKFSNQSQVPHAVEIEGNGVEEKTKVVTGADAPALKVKLKPGTYEFYCPVDGHRAAGMEGKLTVR